MHRIIAAPWWPSAETLAYMTAIGYQDHARKIQMRHDAIFWIASTTKPVTSVAAMMLVEEGKLDLDTPVSRYLPDLDGMQVTTEVADPTIGETKFAIWCPQLPENSRQTNSNQRRDGTGPPTPADFASLPITRAT